MSLNLDYNSEWYAAVGQLSAHPTREHFKRVMNLFVQSLPAEQRDAMYASLMIACVGNAGPYSINYSGQAAYNQPSTHTYIGNINVHMPSSPVAPPYSPLTPLTSPVAPPYSPLTPLISPLTTADTVRPQETSSTDDTGYHLDHHCAYHYPEQDDEAQQAELEAAASALLAACAEDSAYVENGEDDEGHEQVYFESGQAHTKPQQARMLSDDEQEAVMGLLKLSNSSQGH